MLAHERSECIVAGAEARAQLLNRGRGSRLVRPLGNFKTLFAESGRRLSAGKSGETGDVGLEEARTLFDQAA